MNQLFNIFRIDAVRANEIAAMPDEPHLHDFEELIVGMQGRLEHFVDFKLDIVEAPLVSFIAKGKAHRIITKLQNGNFDMWVLRFKSEFIAETIFQLYSSFHNNANNVFQTRSCFNRLSAICEIIDQEMIPRFRENDYFGGIMTGARIIMGLSRGEFTAEQYQKGTSKKGSNGGGIVILILIFLFIILPIIRGGNRRSFNSGSRSLPFWVLMGMMGSGRNRSSWSDFSGGRGGFGGFGGGGSGGGFGGFGGGSFGGGGAGGSW